MPQQQSRAGNRHVEFTDQQRAIAVTQFDRGAGRMVGIARYPVQYRRAHSPALGRLPFDTRGQRCRWEDRRTIATRQRNIAADPMRAADENASGIERIKFRVEII